jgi:hypothetical protein
MEKKMKKCLLFLVLLIIGRNVYTDTIDTEIQETAYELGMEYDTLKLLVDLYANNSVGRTWVWINSNDENRRYVIVLNDDNTYSFTIYEIDGTIYQEEGNGTFSIIENRIIFDNNEDSYFILFRNMMVIINHEDAIVVYVRQ